jgi:hypothetical protein
VNIDLLHKNLINKIKTNTQKQDIDEANSIFCAIPNSEANSLYKGLRRTYYYSCYDVNERAKMNCELWFGKTPGLCSYALVGFGGSMTTSGATGCLTCQEIESCSNYRSEEACTKDLCGIGGCEKKIDDKGKARCLSQTSQS